MACCCPLSLSRPGKPLGPGISPPIPPYFVGDMSERLVAQTGKLRGEVPSQALFRGAPLRTTRAPFNARGSPVTYAALGSRRTPSTTSALCISHTSWSFVSGHLCPFALWTAFPSSLAGRDAATTTGTVSP